MAGRQQVLGFKQHGGRRLGAGRKRSTARTRVPHIVRAWAGPRVPVHVTLRLLDEVGRLRNRRGFAIVRRVMFAVMVAHTSMRIVHLSIQGNHLHLIVEAESREALRRGISAFKISLAKRLNRELGRSGRVFADRYHCAPLRTPRQVRACLRYVLSNWRKHGEPTTTLLDPYSTADRFVGWKGHAPAGDPRGLPSTPARSWLLREGWRRGGGPIDPRERPSG